MSNTSKNDAVKTVTEIAEKQGLTTVPEQNTGENTAPDAKTAAVLVLGDAVKAVENGALASGVTVKLTLVDGELQTEIIEGTKRQRLVSGAKGVFQRNKKLVIATAGLLVASAVLKAIAARQGEEYTDGEIVTDAEGAETTEA